MNICDCVAPEHVELNVDVRSKPRLLETLARKAATATGVDERAVLLALESREQLGSTGIGAGIALPHASLVALQRPFALILRLRQPIEFDSIDGAAVDIVCLVLTPADSAAPHLTLLSRVARLLRAPDALAKIRAAATAKQIHDVLRGISD
ncbi:hypothetical protein ASE63_23600 [Bosea sp. Root381]|uniref:PTS sugar transporter subunit IIA n=1 Tax=Bosea sp. Root381 TaxID=1736524 RepID=UPI0006F35D9E|nr:PTS sugar transporter subunit IIA [Bosea sp. Root381]KRE06698.1 hypothetical protein ASE63_23600 [Bosea sp. Root381]